MKDIRWDRYYSPSLTCNNSIVSRASDHFTATSSHCSSEIDEKVSEEECRRQESSIARTTEKRIEEENNFLLPRNNTSFHNLIITVLLLMRRSTSTSFSRWKINRVTIYRINIMVLVLLVCVMVVPESDKGFDSHLLTPSL